MGYTPKYMAKFFNVGDSPVATLFYGLVVRESRRPHMSWVLFTDGEWAQCSHEEIRRCELKRFEVPILSRNELLGRFALSLS